MSWEKADLGVKGWVLDHAVDEDPEVVLDHEGLDIAGLVLLVQHLSDLAAVDIKHTVTQTVSRHQSTGSALIRCSLPSMKKSTILVAHD